MLDCTPEIVIERQIAAYRDRDAVAFAAFYAPDAVLYDHPGVVVMRGREEIEAEYAQSFARSPNARVTIEARILNGDYVIDKELIEDGAFSGRVTVIYHVAGCEIDRVDFLPLVMSR